MGLTAANYQEAAGRIGCDVPAIRAVDAVESAGSGFLTDGRVKVLFEGHVFSRLTKGRFNLSYPTISYPRWTRDHYARGANADERGAGELTRLALAIGLDRTAALMSASYGRFQIMGFNFALCDYRTIEEFYTAMQVTEGAHLAAFVAYVANTGLADELIRHDWPRFARLYNGPLWRRNDYAGKLARAFARFNKESS